MGAAFVVSRSVDAVAGAGRCARTGTARMQVVRRIMASLMVPPGCESMTDREEPGSDHRTALWPLTRLRRRRAGGKRTVFRLEEIRDVLLRVHRNRFRSAHRGDC